MKKKALVRNIICIVLAGCMTFFSGLTTFAASNAIDGKAEKINFVQRISKQKHYLEDAINKLVEEGKITKEKADKIIEYKKKRVEEFKKLPMEKKQQSREPWQKKGLLDSMQEDGIITSEDANAIRAKIREIREARFSGAINELVSKGVLTKDDVSNIESYLIKVRDEKKAEYEKLKDMNEEQRKEYFRKVKKDRKDIITRMVEEKVITKKQAEELRKALPELTKYRTKKVK